MTEKFPKTKIFCIGFQKTGTTSLGIALAQLGCRVEGYHPFRDLARMNGLDMDTIWTRALELVPAYDAFKDTPWPALYDRLDAIFPDAKFIHVMRDRESWIKSVVGDFGSNPNEIHRMIYGSAFPLGNEEAWLARYDQHNHDVQKHFDGRPESFMSLDMSKGELNWNRLCGFLDQPVPDVSWPHANTKRAKSLKMFWGRTKSKLSRINGNQ